jgi:hypothetical protein
MGMQISGSTSASQGAAAWQQRQQGVQSMMKALTAGDLAGAQSAYASMSNGTNAVQGSGPLAQIGKALQSGDLGAAQQAAQSLQAARGGQHHHHHQPTTPVVATATTQPPTPAGAGSMFNLAA